MVHNSIYLDTSIFLRSEWPPPPPPIYLYVTYVCISNNNNNKRPLTPKSMPQCQPLTTYCQLPTANHQPSTATPHTALPHSLLRPQGGRVQPGPHAPPIPPSAVPPGGHPQLQQLHQPERPSPHAQPNGGGAVPPWRLLPVPLPPAAQPLHVRDGQPPARP